MGTETGFYQYRGFHTHQLESPFEINPGDSVYFVMEFSHGGYPFDRTADVPVLLGSAMRVIVESSASPGESWFHDGSWQDLYTGRAIPTPERPTSA